jgi:hypothetical protein
VVDGTEKVLQVAVHDPLPSTLDLLPHLAHRVPG